MSEKNALVSAGMDVVQKSVVGALCAPTGALTGAVTGTTLGAMVAGPPGAGLGFAIGFCGGFCGGALAGIEMVNLLKKRMSR